MITYYFHKFHIISNLIYNTGIELPIMTFVKHEFLCNLHDWSYWINKFRRMPNFYEDRRQSRADFKSLPYRDNCIVKKYLYIIKL